jgi:hypothetical protein
MPVTNTVVTLKPLFIVESEDVNTTIIDILLDKDQCHVALGRVLKSNHPEIEITETGMEMRTLPQSDKYWISFKTPKNP